VQISDDSAQISFSSAQIIIRTNLWHGADGIIEASNIVKENYFDGNHQDFMLHVKL
jgi:hypothetical protein